MAHLAQKYDECSQEELSFIHSSWFHCIQPNQAMKLELDGF